MASHKRYYIKLAILVLVIMISMGIYIVHDAFQTSSISYMLLVAADQGDVDGVKSSLKSGADANFWFEGDTPLSVARKHRFRQIEQLLLDSETKKNNKPLNLR